jgi:hypothetical protein
MMKQVPFNLWTKSGSAVHSHSSLDEDSPDLMRSLTKSGEVEDNVMQQQIEDLIDTNAGKHAVVLARHAQRDRQSRAGSLFGQEPLQSSSSYMNEEITSWTGIPEEQVSPVSPVPGWTTQEIVNLTMCAPMGIISKKEGYDYCNLCPRYWSD